MGFQRRARRGHGWGRAAGYKDLVPGSVSVLNPAGWPRSNAHWAMPISIAERTVGGDRARALCWYGRFARCGLAAVWLRLRERFSRWIRG